MSVYNKRRGGAGAEANIFVGSDEVDVIVGLWEGDGSAGAVVFPCVSGVGRIEEVDIDVFGWSIECDGGVVGSSGEAEGVVGDVPVAEFDVVAVDEVIEGVGELEVGSEAE